MRGQAASEFMVCLAGMLAFCAVLMFAAGSHAEAMEGEISQKIAERMAENACVEFAAAEECENCAINAGWEGAFVADGKAAAEFNGKRAERSCGK